MSFQQQTISTKRPILIFLKHVGPPIVLYVDDSDAMFVELQEIMLKASPSNPKIIEKTGKGPVKKIAVLDTQIAGLAIQEEAFMS
ncbi:MAG: hypothetical protein PHV68_06960 [Candidatus Gastranaerophilales bacterium]|nr:hypothetical protein [Candidatus Gastranaerophilales bacterium]